MASTVCSIRIPPTPPACTRTPRRPRADKKGKRQALMRPSSRVTVKFLRVLQRHGYIGEDHRPGEIVVEIAGRFDECGRTSPRYGIQLRELERSANRVSPAPLSSLHRLAS
ncbi:40S ribosomal protein S15a [Neofusicoccum parvum]|uniref:40S ribosomal protein S15a n=1 Tax=Neofusicoccum parvum TaxID=310453 RepID=A0ACB5SNN8_9PEZI|nr:40S ribosomal protein S15a [Neofusicoccum parvum]